jgi:nicotinate phosphoribosyltransferase
VSDPLFTDLYELTMAASYVAEGLEHDATFDLFVRSLPDERRFLVAAGLDDALTYLEELRFDDPALRYLSSLDLFDTAFLDYLREVRFDGDVWAISEGEVVFAEEPLLEITAPLPHAQLVETALLNCIGSQTMLASKAARISIACAGRSFVDFSARRDHGADAAVRAARAAVVGGASGTSLVAAGARYGLPLSGTMAHSYVMAFADERDAFRAYARRFPFNAVLLLDTYDTVRGAQHAVEVAAELAGDGITIAAVRLDSGDLGALAREVRGILDDAGCAGVRIFASGDLDEYRIADLLAAGAPIDAFGVGTQLGTSGDAPWLGVVYKLVEDADGPKIKLAPGKVTQPGRKQVYRGEASDVIAARDEDVGAAAGRPLLECVMAGGQRTAAPEPVAGVRERCRAAVGALPAALRALEPDGPRWPVRTSAGLDALSAELVLAHAAPGGVRG